MSQIAPERRVYRISIWRYLLLWWVLGPLLFLGFGIAIFADEKTRGAGVIIVCLMTPCFLLWHWLARKSRLEISSEGVRQRELGGGLDATWREIVDFRMDAGHEGFITARPLEGKGAERLAAYAGPMQMFDDRDMQLIAERRFVPIKQFAFHLRRGDMRQVILEHAPHLKCALGAIDAPPQPRPPLTAAGRRKNWLLAGVIALALAAGFALIAMGERWQAWFFTIAYCLLDPLVALFSFFYAWQFFKKRAWLLGVLTALLALVMAGWTLNNWKQFRRMLHDSPSAQSR